MPMRVLLTNSRGLTTGRLFGLFPDGQLGHLYAPDQSHQKYTYDWLPYGIDNGAYPAWIHKQEWDEPAFLSLLAWAQQARHEPMWVAVPDVITDPKATLALWDRWEKPLRDKFGWPLAFVAQDGHTPADVPKSADLVFIGGSTEFKLAAIDPFCRALPRVHVGRVNTYKRLRLCADAGVESVDGTGFFRGNQEQYEGLIRFLEEDKPAGALIEAARKVLTNCDHAKKLCMAAEGDEYPCTCGFDELGLAVGGSHG